MPSFLERLLESVSGHLARSLQYLRADVRRSRMLVTIVCHNTLEALQKDDLLITLSGGVCSTLWTLKYVLLSFLRVYRPGLANLYIKRYLRTLQAF
jgi:hypothetical protein